jgi:acyl-CoA synthetase (AMP-forming)/AMP-acid ligase II
MPTPLTTPSELIHAIRYRARVDPQGTFLTYLGEGGTETVTNIELADRVDAVAASLRLSGFGPGDACVVHTGNTVGFVVSMFAIIEAGGTMVPTIAQSSSDELAYVIEHSGARLVVTTHDLLGVSQLAAKPIGVPICLDDSFTAMRPPLSRVDLSDSVSGLPDDIDILMYTSGTSGRPKGVQLSRKGIEFTADTYAEHLRLIRGDTVLICMPLFHVNGMMLQLLPAVMSGASIVLAPRFSASSYWRWVDDHDVSVGHLVSGLVRLLTGSLSQPSDTHRLRAMTFGLPLESQEIAAFEVRFGLQLLMVWGLTETSCGATLMGLDHRRRGEYQNVGVILRGWEVQVWDETQQEVPVGESGELMVRSPGVMRAYHRDEAATAATLFDRFVATGDLGYVDADGYVHFMSRIKDMLKPSGENVAAAEIANALLRHGSVEEAAVFGVDDPIRIEKVIAVVVTRKNESTDEDKLRQHCSELLASFKVPSEIHFASSIPKTSIGKQQVAVLKSQYVQRQRIDEES